MNEAPAVTVARVSDNPDSTAGTRVLVDRLWPRGVRKEHAALGLWLKEIAPSTELRRWYGHDPALFAEFSSRYRTELGSGEQADALARLRSLRAEGPVVLLTSARAVDISDAAVLASVLTEDSDAPHA
ncbi:DUF488 domain-containing protein [Mycetocola reblochoni]|uniref:DUF488 family protein n=2 Tax=Mycetocola reblochoni TaxID=331618 RepID=A0A3L6ZQ03_9MICO|nr:DUF488 family protein [Mycetocola reblochoni]RLP70024.1 DUF488 family protein [Mycetocola reblochoni]SJN29187.1 probable uroporphyrin-III c-methyltransferase [Mycetocola reblochoni REB411]